MIYSTATVRVNPQGEIPLTRSQAWAGPVLKARDARLFLPRNLCTYCEVVEESETPILREANMAGVDLREIIAFEPESKLTFFQPTGPREGAWSAVEDEIGKPSPSLLRLPRPSRQGTGPPRRASGVGWMDGDNGTAPLVSTLKRTRELNRPGLI